MKDALRVWVIGAVLVGGVLLVGGWFIGVQPLLSVAAANDAAAAQAAQQNLSLQARLRGLQIAQADLGQLRVAAARAEDAVPSSLDAQSFVNRLNVLAAEDGVKVAALTPGAPIAYTQPDAGASKVEAYVDPRISAADLAVIPIAVQVTGSDRATRAFLGHVQHDSRLFLVSGLTLSTSATSGTTTATISGHIYALKAASGS